MNRKIAEIEQKKVERRRRREVNEQVSEFGTSSSNEDKESESLSSVSGSNSNSKLEGRQRAGQHQGRRTNWNPH